MKVQIYAHRPIATEGSPTRKTPQIESVLTYENAKRIAEQDTGVIYPTWDAAQAGVLRKNMELAKAAQQ